MERIKTYPMLAKENKILGLEMIDSLILALTYLIVFLLSKNLILNLILLTCAYFALRAYKKNKPPHYTQGLVHRLIRPSRYTETREVSL